MFNGQSTTNLTSTRCHAMARIRTQNPRWWKMSRGLPVAPVRSSSRIILAMEFALGRREQIPAIFSSGFLQCFQKSDRNEFVRLCHQMTSFCRMAFAPWIVSNLSVNPLLLCFTFVVKRATPRHFYPHWRLAYNLLLHSPVLLVKVITSARLVPCVCQCSCRA
jgi:hypothetical protein